MHAQTADRRGPGRPPGRNAEHPIHALTVPIVALADEIGVKRTTLQSWINGDRAIPRAHAEKLQKLHGLPLSAWAKVRN